MSTSASPPAAPKQIFGRLLTVAKTQLSLTDEQIEKISPELPLVEGLQLDSLAQVTLIAAIEDEFGVEFELEDRQRITTIRDLVELIEERSASN